MNIDECLSARPGGKKMPICISVQKGIDDGLVLMYETASLAGDQTNKGNPKSKQKTCV